jgi:aminomuconate-semialdehyde/2-hydroxymuconate-6-semialdehyde dehydrogenase
MKKLTLELGGKNPNIVFADCDYESMLDTTIRSSFSNQGQLCLCGSRILVESSLYERFLTDFVARTKNLRVGDPRDPETELGAMVSNMHFEKVMGHIATARDEGGTIVVGGNQVTVGGRCRGGRFIEPTVVTGLDPSCSTNQEEIFGPVVTVAPFSDEADAIAQANTVRYGLAASVWTTDSGKAWRVAADVQAGVVWVNTWMFRDLRTPFGGVKGSGIGREGGFDALDFMTSEKTVTVRH